MSIRTIGIQSGGSLAVRPAQTEWTPEQQVVLRQSGIDDGVTRAELQGFLHLCQRTGLDPFSRQIYLIGRYDRRQMRKVYAPQTSIDGYRVIAHRAAAEAGHTLGYEDTLWCASDGQWRDVWLSDTPPAAAKVTVIRNGMRFSAVARYAEYVQLRDEKPSGLWGKMPSTMTAKCAESLALRMAFPHDLAGVYTSEEMGQADSSAPDPSPRRAQPVNDERQPSPEPVPEAEAPQRDFLAEADEAVDADTVRQVYRDAARAGAAQAYLEQIAEIGRSKPAAEPALTAEDPPEDADVVVGEAVEDPLVVRLREAAAAVGLDSLDEEFARSYGVSIPEASPGQLREMTSILTGPVAA
ncbi:phage recombination protein Bet [Streptomyces albidoflavus]|uniref:phage recombination protein Bet n=1 Tax=Streptomyces albidoflavus TaxID=1886 RepID=UPI00352E96A5